MRREAVASRVTVRLLISCLKAVLREAKRSRLLQRIDDRQQDACCLSTQSEPVIEKRRNEEDGSRNRHTHAGCSSCCPSCEGC